MLKMCCLRIIAIALFIFYTAIYSDSKTSAQNITQRNKGEKSITVKNFGKIDNCYYRGAQPSDYCYTELYALGIKTVIDLRHYFVLNKWALLKQKTMANNLGMNYINIPMLPCYPPTNKQICDFFCALENPNNLPVFVFCKEGRDRTGVMTALYRFRCYNWTYKEAYAEMKRYGHHSILYPELKGFLRDYNKACRVKVK